MRKILVSFLGGIFILFLTSCSTEEIEDLQQNFSGLQEDLIEVQDDYESLLEDYNQTQEELDLAELNLTNTEEELEVIKGQLEDLIDNYNQTQSDLETTESQLNELQNDYDEAIIQLEDSIEEIDIESKLFNIINDVSESVVSIKGYDGYDKYISSGSGVIYRESNNVYYLITNYHVIDGVDHSKVFLSDNSEEMAYVVGYDYYLDIAVLRFNSNADFPVVEFGDSSEVSSGDFVLAIGSPLGELQFNSTTFGIVSGKDRLVYDDLNDYYGELYIQHDAAINPGSSGGALFDVDGKLIGINTLKFVDESVEGMGFAIQSNAVQNVVKIIEGGDFYKRTYLNYDILRNVNYIKNNPEEYPNIFIPNSVKNGVYVDGIYQGGLFSSAGIYDGDIITKIDGENVDFWYEVYYQLFYEHTIYDNFTITVIRNESELHLDYYASSTDIYSWYGRQDYSSGDYYIGAFFDDLREGYGEYYWNDGDVYSGYWSNGNRDGYGMQEFINGNYYLGYYKNDSRYGYGGFYWEDDYYVGIWSGDTNSPLGMYYWEDGSSQLNSIIDSEWIDIYESSFIEYDSTYIDSDEQLVYEFTLIETQTIYAYSNGSVDTYGYLFRDSTLLYEDDDSANDYNFLIEIELYPGTYTLIVEGYSSLDEGFIDIFIGTLD